MSFYNRLLTTLHEHHASEGLKASILMLYKDHVACFNVEQVLNDHMHESEIDDYQKYVEAHMHSQLTEAIKPLVTRKIEQSFMGKKIRYSIKILREEADDSTHIPTKDDFRPSKCLD